MLEKVFQKGQIWTIPNIMSLFRLILIPFIIVYYFTGHYTVAIVLIAISALSDVLDGPIARHFNMISDLGKILDPLADKLTEGALLVCLGFRYKLMIVLFLVMALKEFFMVKLGLKAISQGTVISAQWFGKVYTVLIYATVLALLIFKGIPHNVGNIMIGVCNAVALFTLIKYIGYYGKVIRKENEKLPQ